MTVENEDGPVGYFWFSPVKSDGGTIMEMHTACKPGWAGRWLTRDAIRLGYSLLDAYDVGNVIALHSDPDMKRSLTQLGFVSGDHISILNIEELEHGKGIGQRLWRSRNSRGDRSKGRKDSHRPQP